MHTVCEATERVIRQLVEALLYENLVVFEEVLQQNNTCIYYIQGQSEQYVCTGKRTGFERVRLKSDIKRQSGAPVLLQELVAELLPAAIQSEILHELERTIHLSNWNKMNVNHILRRQMNYEELESAIDEGHPYHPCYKARTGFSDYDHERFGPEAGGAFYLYWLAVKREHTKLMLPTEEQSFWQKELGGYDWKMLITELYQQGGNIMDYTFLPVHPWQWKQCKEKWDSLITEKELIPLGYAGDLYRATQSIRTLWNQDNSLKSYIKLSMNMSNTSAKRVLAPESVTSAPSVSRWLRTVISSDSYFHSCGFQILEEYAGVVYDPASIQLRALTEGQLGVIWRKSVRHYVNEGENVLPFTALLVTEQDHAPFVDTWIQKYGLQAWFTQLVNVAVLPVWHLLLAHGIAIEAHAQNLLLVHKEGWPLRVIARDFHESVEYTEEFIANGEWVPDFSTYHEHYQQAEPDKYFCMSSVEALRELFTDTMFVFHFSELIYVMSEYYKVDELLFWKLIYKAMNLHIESRPHLRERAEGLCWEDSFVQVESLLKRKLYNAKSEYHHTVQNTLAVAAEKGDISYVVC
ncbi:siderophore biosynthesis protein [Ectobacillus sp. JY-23]|uniref:IucA/IucC family protein n=1 Tax=Ectobacillus sp. JY-23 TaxID=2933872 RepID=UPI001FF45BFB|nr:IucA/IucC family protein [Ectobacillus sp. JY-23]UOY91883.1 siderophore biosynthesis protein [Ectobacillus sp. JY-23]